MSFYYIITGLSIILIPLSVTGSQSLMALSIITGILLGLRRSIQNRRSGLRSVSQPDNSSNQAGLRKWLAPGSEASIETWVFYSGWFLFAWLLLVYGIRSAQFYISGNSLYNPAPYHNELTDFFLYLFAFLAAIPMLSRPLKGRSEKELLLTYNRIYLVLTVFSVLVILSGLGAVFSEVRLSKLFTGHGTDFHAGNRPQFVFRTLGELTLYRPIGFMNTRLSYAGLLIFALPVLLNRFLESLQCMFWRNRTSAASKVDNDGDTHGTIGHENTASANRLKRSSSDGIFQGSPLQQWTSLLIWAGLWASGLILLAMNGSRSGQIGVLVSQILLLLYFGRKPIKKILEPVQRYLVPMAMVGLILASGLYLYLLDSGTTRHTDFMRPLIWKGSFSIFLEHPMLGVGPGNFTDWFHRWASDFYLEYPRTMYFLEITPDSHAHNDLLHLLALGGLPGGILFLLLVGGCFRALSGAMSEKEGGLPLEAQSPASGSDSSISDSGIIEGLKISSNARLRNLEVSLRAALPGFFVAGLSQCYFQDDEVVVVFWSFLFAAGALQFVRRALAQMDPG